MYGIAAFHSADGRSRVLSGRPLTLTASGADRIGYTSFWLAPLRARVLTPAAAGSSVLQVERDYDWPVSGSFVVDGARYDYIVDASQNLILGRPLETGIAANSLIQYVPDSSSAPSLQIRPIGLDLASGEFSIWIRGAAAQDYFPAAAGYAEPAYFGGTDSLLLGCGFRGSLDDWSGHRTAVSIQGPEPVYLSAGVAPESGICRLDSDSYAIWRFLSETLSDGTLEIWFRPERPGGIARLSSASGELQIYTSSAGYLEVSDGANVLARSRDQVAFGKWTFLAIVWSASSAWMYLNGWLSGSWAFPAAAAAAPFDLQLLPAAGDVDELRLFNRRLPSSAVSSHWNLGYGCGLLDAFLPAFRIDLKISAIAGAEAFWPHLALTVNSGSDGIQLPLEAARIDSSGMLQATVLPASALLEDEIGFLIGEHRWPYPDYQPDAVPVLPSRWDWNPREIGLDKFSSGVARQSDLIPIGPVRDNHSLYLRMKPGFYFIGPDRHYYPSGSGFKIVRYSSSGQEGVIHLDQPLKPQTPVFVRTYRMDQFGMFRLDVDFVHRPRLSGSGPEVHELVVEDRSSGLLRLSGRFQSSEMLLGRVPEIVDPGGSSIWLDLPVYPVWSLQYVQLSDGRQVTVQAFNRETGRVQIRVTPSMAGLDLLFGYEPAVLVIYEPEWAPSEFLAPGIDMNPAVSGIASGYVVVTHQRTDLQKLTLFCDKPKLLFEHSPAAQADMVVFGPVYYGTDFAVLMVEASDFSGRYPVANLDLHFKVMSGFQGYLRYVDPLQSSVPVTASTNGDGMAWMIYTPPKVYGIYFHPSQSSWSSGNTRLRLTLPADASIFRQQIYNERFHEPWMVRLYFVRNNHPYLGKVGADLSQGEVEWVEYGDAGTSRYRTNGFRELQQTQSAAPLVPVQAYDSANRPLLLGQGQLNEQFFGEVRSIEFEFPGEPDLANLGAYFISLIGLVGVWVEDPVSGIRSNTIYLQLDMPQQVIDQEPVSGYLRLTTTDGRLNIHRLGGGPLPRFVVAVPKL